MKKTHDISEQEWISCKDYFNYECAYCSMSEEEHKILHNQQLHKEHAVDEGANDLSNCIPACKICNSTKNNRDFDEWYTKSNSIYSEDRFNKIIKWLTEDYKLYIKI